MNGLKILSLVQMANTLLLEVMTINFKSLVCPIVNLLENDLVQALHLLHILTGVRILKVYVLLMDLMNCFIITLQLGSKIRVVQLLLKMRFGIQIVVFWVGLFKVFGKQVKMVPILTIVTDHTNLLLIKSNC